MTHKERIEEVQTFVTSARSVPQSSLSAVSLFSGAGLSDIGYEKAGFTFRVQVEIEPIRAELGRYNFPDSDWITDDVRNCTAAVVRSFRAKEAGDLDLLVATPPCQGLSSSNPSRGRRDSGLASYIAEKNRLLLSIVTVADELRPRVIVAENVRQILTLQVEHEGRIDRVPAILASLLPSYIFFEGLVNVADFGIPQDRRRAVIVGVRGDQEWACSLKQNALFPWPKPTHAESASGEKTMWVSIREWLEHIDYIPLDSRSEVVATGKSPLHFVPHYAEDRYLLVHDIPPHSGRSAYENDVCPECNRTSIPLGVAICPFCSGVLKNRPIVRENGTARLIKGFHSSYRRMDPDLPAPTVTTNSSHIGSDFKIHPWQNRVLSIQEVADLQTVPQWYSWQKAIEAHRHYLIRNLVGEAFPPYFTFLHGKVISGLLSGVNASALGLATCMDTRLGHRRTKKHKSTAVDHLASTDMSGFP